MNIYICRTPYHIIISCLHITNTRHKNNFLIVIKDFDFKMIENLININNCFKRVMILDGLNTKNKIIRKIKTLKNLFTIKQNIKSSQKNNYYIFNDIKLEEKFIISITKENNNLYYIEDGSAPYNNHYLQLSMFDRSLLSLLCIKHENTHILGSNSAFSKLYVLYPAYIRKELKNKKILTIQTCSMNILINIILRKKECFYDIKSGDALIILDKEQSEKDFIEKYSNFYNKYQTVWIKYHPLNERIIPTKGKNIIDINMSLEIIFLQLNACNIKVDIFGYTSTALMTAIIFNCANNVYSLNKMDIKNNYFLLLHNIGIIFLNEKNQYYKV